MNSETHQKVLERNNYICEHPGCLNRSTEVAHRIAQTKSNRQDLIKKAWSWVARGWMKLDDFISMKKAKELLDDELNLAGSCKEHNDYFNIGFKRVSAESLMEEILRKEFKDD